ncbi:Uncharacterised protein [Mycobacteroides abscessus subsp. abscessus]|nr:Uncharacterised protein [Mycobacteroides abscessus subsp. abscessus]
MATDHSLDHMCRHIRRVHTGETAAAFPNGGSGGVNNISLSHGLNLT